MGPRSRRQESHRPIVRVAALAGATLIGLGTFLLVGVSSAWADNPNDGGGVGITFEVPTSTATPSPTPTPTPSDNGGGNGNNTGGGGDGGNSGGGGSGGVGNGGGGKSGGSGGVPDNGPVNVGGLNARFIPSSNPLHGTVVARISVHNGSTSTITSSVRFWLTNPVGATISDTGAVVLAPLKPNTTVVIERTLGNVGQWTVITAHATYRPPALVDGHPLGSITRDLTIVALSWLGGAGLGSAAVGLIIFSVLRVTAAGALILKPL